MRSASHLVLLQILSLILLPTVPSWSVGPAVDSLTWNVNTSKDIHFVNLTLSFSHPDGLDCWLAI